MTQETGKKESFFDILNDLNWDKKNLYRENENWERLYNPFMINLMLSQHVDALFLVNELNMRSSMPKKWQHDYLFHTLSKKKRFGKLAKPAKNEDVELIQEIFNYSKEKAMAVIDLFDKAELQEMRESRETGGFGKRGKK